MEDSGNRGSLSVSCGSFSISSSTAKALRREIIEFYFVGPVYDIRTWNEAHTEYGKGVTVTAGQMIILKRLLDQIEIF